MFSASDVKTVREKTGAGMLDCKKALQETNGNIEAAIDYLREKGIAKAAKKSDRIAAEGLAQVFTKDNDGLHPTEEGYEEFYLPVFQKSLGI